MSATSWPFIREEVRDDYRALRRMYPAARVRWQRHAVPDHDCLSPWQPGVPNGILHHGAGVADDGVSEPVAYPLPWDQQPEPLSAAVRLLRELTTTGTPTLRAIGTPTRYPQYRKQWTMSGEASRKTPRIRRTRRIQRKRVEQHRAPQAGEADLDDADARSARSGGLVARTVRGRSPSPGGLARPAPSPARGSALPCLRGSNFRPRRPRGAGLRSVWPRRAQRALGRAGADPRPAGLRSRHPATPRRRQMATYESASAA